jgi:hypothetical protein
MSDKQDERKGRGTYPCRTCGVGHHVKGKCDMCGVDQQADNEHHERWLMKKRRQQVNNETWG